MRQITILALFSTMLCAHFHSLLAQPPAEKKQTVADGGLPEGSEQWDAIGSVRLDDQGKQRTIKLYFRDSNSIALKNMQKGGIGVFSYPNFFALHAVYQGDSGKWIHRELFGRARVGFERLLKQTSESVVVLVHGNYMVSAFPGEELKDWLNRQNKINKPFPVVISFVGGSLTAQSLR